MMPSSTVQGHCRATGVEGAAATVNSKRYKSRSPTPRPAVHDRALQLIEDLHPSVDGD